MHAPGLGLGVTHPAGTNACEPGMSVHMSLKVQVLLPGLYVYPLLAVQLGAPGPGQLAGQAALTVTDAVLEVFDPPALLTVITTVCEPVPRLPTLKLPPLAGIEGPPFTL